MKMKTEVELILFCNPDHPEGFGDDEDNPYVAGMDGEGQWYWIYKNPPYLELITSQMGIRVCATSLVKKTWVEINKLPWQS